jgi:hypothetical protein
VSEAELTWDGVQVCDDAELEARLYPDLVPSTAENK